MWNNQGPFRLVLNGGASKEIEWHCKHYSGRGTAPSLHHHCTDTAPSLHRHCTVTAGLMKYFKNGEAIAKEMNIDPAVSVNSHLLRDRV